jgi:hypothetical protein
MQTSIKENNMPLASILNIQENTAVSVIQEKTAVVQDLGQLDPANIAPWINNETRIEKTEALSANKDELLSKLTALRTAPKA